MKMGAVDYIAKPFEHNEIIEAVAKIIRENPSQRQVSAADSEDECAPITGMIGSCSQMQSCFDASESRSNELYGAYQWRIRHRQRTCRPGNS